MGLPPGADWDLHADGACHYGGLAAELLPALAEVLTSQPSHQAGLRMVGIAPLARMLGPDSLIGQKVTDLGGVPAHPVRAVLFNKAGDMNWALGWHQDRTIAVRQRVDTPGFGPWSVKRGIQHVEPPFAVIAAMLTVRIHIDRVDEDNAPLLVALGSHRLGRIAVTDVGAVVERCTIRPCLADAGDVWIYHTPVVHASRAARPGRRRRVLQVDYASQHLPAGLEWLGI